MNALFERTRNLTNDIHIFAQDRKAEADFLKSKGDRASEIEAHHLLSQASELEALRDYIREHLSCLKLRDGSVAAARYLGAEL